jgi:hypothetical protein
MPSLVPLTSLMDWYLLSLPVITALETSTEAVNGHHP